MHILQVKHFDQQQEQNARLTKALHNTIQKGASTSAGNLAGK
jgi:hypothetical protein